MCGICGIFNFRTSAPVDPSPLRRAATAMAHRGPDDEGYYLDGALGLGNRRLSIIDLTGGNNHQSAFLESHRAVGQLLDWVLV